MHSKERSQRSTRIIKATCNALQLLKQEHKGKRDENHKTFQNIESIIQESTKILCESHQEAAKLKAIERWSTDLVAYLMAKPEKWQDTINIILGENYLINNDEAAISQEEWEEKLIIGLDPESEEAKQTLQIAKQLGNKEFCHWRKEHTEYLLQSTCLALVSAKQEEATKNLEEFANQLQTAVYESSRIFCDAEQEVTELKTNIKQTNRWSTDLPRYLGKHPEQYEDVMRILKSNRWSYNFYHCQELTQTSFNL